jgi:RNA polymerase sigma-70 factor (ECF subfamily)
MKEEGSPMPLRTRDEFTQRLQPLQRMLVVLARRLVDDRGDAEDVLQAALASAFRHRDRFDPDTNFRAWLSKFLVHEAANANRVRGRRRGHREGSIEPDDDRASASPMAGLEAEERWEECLSHPDHLIEDLDRDLARALLGLGENERAALLLHSVLDLRCAEIARTLGVSAGTVMSWLYRARVEVRRRLSRAPTHDRSEPQGSRRSS